MVWLAYSCLFDEGRCTFWVSTVPLRRRRRYFSGLGLRAVAVVLCCATTFSGAVWWSEPLCHVVGFLCTSANAPFISRVFVS